MENNPSKRLGINIKKWIVATITILCGTYTFHVNAQNSIGAIPEITTMDRNRVDLLSHMPFLQHTDLSIGDGNMSLTHRINIPAWYNSIIIDNFRIGHLQLNQPALSDSFAYDGTEINFNGYDRPKSLNGETLKDIGNGLILLTMRDGTKITTNKWSATASGNLTARIETPAGLVTEVFYKYYVDANGAQRARRQSIVQNNGLQLKYNYNTSNVLISVVAINNAVDYCNPIADTCNFTKNWPTVNYSTENVTTTQPGPCQYCPPEVVVVPNAYRFIVKDQSGINTYYDYAQNRLASYTKPGNRSMIFGWLDASRYKDDGTAIPYTVERGFFISTVRDNAMTFNYKWSFTIDNVYGSSSVDGPIQAASTQHARGLPTRVNSEGMEVIFDGSEANRVSSVVYPTGANKAYAWDSRGNIAQTTTTASGAPTLIETAGYDATCNNPVKCNKPNWIKDANGNQTDYTYYTTAPIGLLKSTTSPVGANGYRPQTRYEYVQRSAWFKNAAGGYTSGSPIWLISKEISCVNGNTCAAGSNDEVVTTYDYGPNNGPNNLFLRGIVKTAFDGQSIRSLRTCYGYDIYGHKISETSPKAHLASCP